MREILPQAALLLFSGRFQATLEGGKMLRARLVQDLGIAAGQPEQVRVCAGAAVEMLHAASLLHDDIVDGGTRRRGVPALWVTEGARAAVILGDLLMSLAVECVQQTLPDRIPLLVATFREMCEAEAEQEFALFGDDVSRERCISIARRKTGSLFGFAARCAAGTDDTLGVALLRSGTALGTAYQLADDLLDEREDVADAGKTLGSDQRDNKLTATVFRFPGQPDPAAHIKRLLQEADAELEAWPAVQAAWQRYAADVIRPVILSFTGLDAMEEAV